MEKEELKDVLREVLEEQTNAFRVEAEPHYEHHKQMEKCLAFKPEWEENHKFISEVRANGKAAKGIALKILVTALIGGIITIFVRGWHG